MGMKCQQTKTPGIHPLVKCLTNIQLYVILCKVLLDEKFRVSNLKLIRHYKLIKFCNNEF